VLRTRALARYRLRRSGVVVYLRHNTPDLATLHQILIQHHYEVPEQAAEALARTPRPLEILDLGANIGMFAAYFFEDHPSARVVCFEPDSENAALVRKSIDANPGLAWDLVEACAANEDGSVNFTSGLFTNSRIEEDGRGEAVPAVDIFPLAEHAAYLKVDIEGGEWAIVTDPRFTSLQAKVVALEYHDHLCPEPDPEKLARSRLEAAGYEVAQADLESTSGHGMLWGWKPE
jgi:FkbM family methyltransferase